MIKKEFKFPVRIHWEDSQTGAWWNETCATILEVFGLPGGRFMSHPNADYMTFYFKNEKDWQLCKILLSERLNYE